MIDLSECTVLIVDDTETNIDILLDILGEEYDVTVAMDGESALEAVAEEAPDLILLDIMMPGIDGYEVCKKLKDDPSTSGIPVIFLTALTEAEEKQKGLNMGALDYITKPFDAAEIQAKIKKYITEYVSKNG